MDDEFVLKLRSNISLEGDLQLIQMELAEYVDARLEATTIDEVISSSPLYDYFSGSRGLRDNLRPNGRQVYHFKAPISLLPKLVQNSTFVQQIYLIAEDNNETQKVICEWQEDFGGILNCHAENGHIFIVAIPYSALFELSEAAVRVSSDVSEVKQYFPIIVDSLLGKPIPNALERMTKKATSFKISSSPLSHGIHYYKAKFFPRMARSLIDIGQKRIGKDDPIVLDNFVGSGTTLLEAYTLGLSSVGVDIDPLSVQISKCKIDVLSVKGQSLWDEVEKIQRRCNNREKRQTTLFDDIATRQAPQRIEFPEWLMRNRNMSEQKAEELSSEILFIRCIIAGSPSCLQPLLYVMLSDSISRKIRMRILGTGSGRFSLTFSSSSITTLFIESMKKQAKMLIAWEWINANVKLKKGAVDVRVGDARSLPLEPSSCDIVVTSPPYLPSSSGRESYAKSRALSIIAMGLKTTLEVDELIGDSVGSMNGLKLSGDELTSKEKELVSWLMSDQLRSVKAQPIARYFLDMRLALREMHRVLSPGGIAFVVCSKQSVFYQFKTREALYVVPVAEMLSEEAVLSGFDIEEICDIELDKANMNARPRSLDEYYESIIVLRKPQ